MKITIDTKEDSHEEIRKVIRMLSSLVGDSAVTNANIFENPSPEVTPSTNAFGAMFGSDAQTTPETTALSSTNSEKKDHDDIPPVVVYD